MKRMKMGFSILMVLVLMIGALTGCSPKPEPAAEPAAAPAPEKEIRVAIILKTLANPFWVAMKEGIEKEAAALNVKVDIFAVDSEDDVQGQLKKFEDAVAQKTYDAIGFAPISPVSLIPAIVQANEAGLPVVNIDEKVNMEELKNAGGSIVAFVTTDNKQVGEKGATYLSEVIGNAGEVAIIEGKAGNTSGENRRDGAKAFFDTQSGIKVVASQPADWDRVKALDVAANIIQKNPNIKGFYCCNDTMALGAVQAVQNAGLEGKVFVVGTDGVPEAVQAVQDGTLLATVAQDPAKVGATSLQILVDSVKSGKKVSEGEPAMTAVDSNLIKK